MNSGRTGRWVASVMLVTVGIGTGFALSIVTGSTTVRYPTAWSGRLNQLKWGPSTWGGTESIIYSSPDRKRVFGAFKEAGTYKGVTWSFDEYGYVTAGRAHAHVRGGADFNFVKGDVFYFKQGTVADVTLSDDFADVTVLTSNRPINFNAEAALGHGR